MSFQAITRKKVLIVSALVIIAGGFGVYFATRGSNPINVSSEPDHTAQAFIADLRAGNVDAAHAKLSDHLQYSYDQNYWKKDFFARLVNHKNDPKLISKEPVRTKDPSQPPPYESQAEPWRFVYDLQLDGLTYRLTMVVIKEKNQWRINELEGAYLPRA